MSVYVGNIAYEVTREELEQFFADYGTVKRVYLPTDRETGRPRGFGFVEMESDEEEDAAISKLHGTNWKGRDLTVNKARPRDQ